MLMPNHTDSLERINKKLHPLFEDEPGNGCVQQSKEIENCAYDNNEENGQGFEIGERTLPLCFSSFKSLNKNVYNVSNHKSSRHDVEYSEHNVLTNENHLPFCFSSFELLKENHEITKEEGKSDYLLN
jgi:hypothetical protein